MISVDFGMIICLSLTFILCSLLYFYLNKKILILEDSLLNQARVLQNFISSSMNNRFVNSMNATGGGGFTENVELSGNSDLVENQNLMVENSDRINVSDNEEESDEEESDDEESGEEESGEEEDEEESDEEESDEEAEDVSVEKIEIQNTASENNSEVKVVDVSELDNFEIKELQLDADEQSDEDSEVSDEESDDITEDTNVNENNTQQVSDELNVEKEEVVVEKVDEKPNFKKMSLSELKSYAEERNLIEKGKKITKKNLLTLLEE